MAKKDDVEQIFDALMNSGPFDNPSDANERECNEILATIVKLQEGDIRQRLKAQHYIGTLKTAVIRLIYGGNDPAIVPTKYIKHALKYPAKDAITACEARNTIEGPIKGIRVFCLECQGGDPAGIRKCAATNCQLWPFRMGHNPFHGRLAGAEDEVIESEAEVEALQAETNTAVVEIVDAD